LKEGQSMDLQVGSGIMLVSYSYLKIWKLKESEDVDIFAQADITIFADVEVECIKRCR